MNADASTKRLTSTSSTITPSYDNIPRELWNVILSLLHTDKDRCAAAATCSALLKLIHNNIGYDKIYATEDNVRMISESKAIQQNTLVLVSSRFLKSNPDESVCFLAGVHTIDLSECRNVTDVSLKALAGVYEINLIDNQSITDEGIKALAGVHTINIENTKVTDEGVKALAGVHSINIGITAITDESLKALAGVHTIDLTNCVNITNEGLKHLAGVHTISLRAGRNITDAGLKHLAGVHAIDISYMETAKLGRRGITGEGLAELQGVHTLNIAGNEGLIPSDLNDLTGVYAINLEANLYMPSMAISMNALKSVKVMSHGTPGYGDGDNEDFLLPLEGIVVNTVEISRNWMKVVNGKWVDTGSMAHPDLKEVNWDILKTFENSTEDGIFFL